MKKILIIGDSCQDVFVYCDAERLAPDLPVPILRIVDETRNPGMASNLALNVKAIYPHCDLITNPGWKGVTKTRYVHQNSNHMFIRVDAEPRLPRIKMHKISLNTYDIVAISDYNKGFLTEEDIKYICEHHDKVFIDTKKILGNWAAKAKYIKINNFEYERSKHAIGPSLAKKVICTKGSLGAQFRGKMYPVEKVDVKDLTGAGDSFFAALLVKYIETENIEEAIMFANKCAAEVVKHKGVSVIQK